MAEMRQQLGALAPRGYALMLAPLCIALGIGIAYGLWWARDFIERLVKYFMPGQDESLGLQISHAGFEFVVVLLVGGALVTAVRLIWGGLHLIHAAVTPGPKTSSEQHGRSRLATEDELEKEKLL